MNFVSEKELQKQRAQNPETAESESVDNRPLYDRLKEVKDKKQLEWDEDHALKNQFAVTRGLDDGDADFLSQVDHLKEEQEKRKRTEELELISLAKQQTLQTDSMKEHPTQSMLRPVKASISIGISSKPQSFANKPQPDGILIRKRRHTNSIEDQCDVKAKQREPSTTATELTPSPPISNDDKQQIESSASENKQSCRSSVTVLPTLCKMIGVLPSLADYSDSSDECDSSSNSESLESGLPTVAVYSGKGVEKPQQDG